MNESAGESYSKNQRTTQSGVAGSSGEWIGSIIAVQMDRACEIVEESRAGIDILVEGLMEKDTLDSEEIRLSLVRQVR